MANDYISREAAKAILHKRAMETALNNVGYQCDAWVVFQDASHRLKVWLDDVPTADVRPVVRGHYVGEYDGYADGNPVYDMWYCSVCGCCFEDWDEKPTYNFCPSCGADMRPREEGEDG